MTKHAMKIMATVLVASAMAGCWQIPTTTEPEVTHHAPPTRPANHLSEAAVDYGQASDSKSDDAVKTALMWADKAKEAMDTVVRLQDENRVLERQSKALLQQVAKLQTEAAQSQKELDDANELLLEMRRDLDRWKTDVLGFRQELRTARRVQLDALRQVIILLGGQPTTQPSAKQAARTQAESGEPGA